MSDHTEKYEGYEVNSKQVDSIHDCDICGKSYKSRGSLKVHVKSAHKGINYNCRLCDFQTTRQSSLKTHVQSVHEKIKYSCNLSEHQATTQRKSKEAYSVCP